MVCSRGGWARGGLAALLILLPGAAWSQTAETASVVTRLAEEIARGVPRPGGRVAIIPIADAADLYDPQIPAGLTSQLQAGLAAQHEPTRRIEIVAAPEVARAMDELRLPEPIGAAGAALIAGLVGAEYVSVGELTPLGGQRARLSMQLYEAGTRRTLRSESAELRLPAAAALAAGTQLPIPAAPRRPFWNGRRAAIVSGFGLSAAAAFLAMSAERDLRDTKDRLQHVPAGATDEWNALLDEASHQERTRNFWWGAVAGVSGVTIAYMLASESPDRAPRPFPGGLSLPGRWRLHANPLLPSITLRRSF